MSNYYIHLIQANAPAPPNTSGPVAYYKLNEISGPAIDSVNGYNGTLNGTINRNGQYYEYASNDAYVEIPDQDDFSFIDAQGNNTDFVIKTTVIFDGFNSENRAWLVSKRQAFNIQEWQLLYINGEFVFSIWNQTDTPISIRTAFIPNLGQKYILGISHINNELRLFINGVRIETLTIPSNFIFHNETSVVKLGNERFISNLNLIGRQKETLFIKGAGWTDAEISDNFTNGDNI